MAEFNEYYKIALLIAKKIAGVLTKEENLKLEAWRNTSPGNDVLYRSTPDKKEQEDRNQYLRNVDTDLAWEKVYHHIAPNNSRIQSKKIYSLSRIAAIAIITLGGSYLLLQKNGHNDVAPPVKAEIMAGTYKALLITEEGERIELQDTSIKKINLTKGIIISNSGQMVNYHPQYSSASTAGQNIYHRLVVPPGGEFQITLADGSIVWINSGTELKFPVAFTGKSRNIYLKGEAYFSVHKDTAHPFIVNLENNIQVEVLGTEFNINAYPGDLMFQTTLNEGAVKITTAKESIQLIPDQQANCSTKTGEMQLRTVVAANYSAWKDGKFIFEDERLEVIMTRLERWYNVNVFYLRPEIKNFHFTGDLEKYNDFQIILNMIEKSTNVRFEISGNTITVKETAKI